MTRLRALGLVAAALTCLGAGDAPDPAADCIVLLHGLARSDRSMRPLESRLTDAGYSVVNVDYPSTSDSLTGLVDSHVRPGVERCAPDAPAVHFVTHSMGGILTRVYLSQTRPPRLGRVVMLAPPNAGSEVVDTLAGVPLLGGVLGPASRELGTDPNSTPLRLGAVDYPVGVIAGDRTTNLITSSIIPGADDGKVAVERAKVPGMADFLVVSRTHTFIMRAPEVQHQILHFLRSGRFDRDAP